MPPALLRLRQALVKAPPQVLLAAVVLGAALVSALAPRGRGPAREAAAHPPAAASSPLLFEEGEPASRPVEEALEAARKGDLDAYLAQFTEPLGSQLARTRAEKGDGYLRDY